MTTKPDYLERTERVASIASSIAIPLMIALVGWWVQSSISSEGLKKDYVQMAINILQEADKQKDDDLRQWAVAVLEKNSPVPFSPALRSKFFKGAFLPWVIRFPTPPAALMEPPLQLSALPKGKPVTAGETLKTVTENYGRCNANRIKLAAITASARCPLMDHLGCPSAAEIPMRHYPFLKLGCGSSASLPLGESG